MIDIRSLANAELDALLGLLRELHPGETSAADPATLRQTWQRILGQPGLHCLGAFADGTLAGSCTLLIVPNLTHGGRPWAIVENVITAASHRRRGIGRALLAHARALAWQEGCYKLMLQTGRLDAATFAFYEACGFDRHAKQAFIARP